MINQKTEAIQEAIEAAWNNSESQAFREALFPEGKPDQDTFIRRLADCVRQEMQKEALQ